MYVSQRWVYLIYLIEELKLKVVDGKLWKIHQFGPQKSIDESNWYLGRHRFESELG